MQGVCSVEEALSLFEFLQSHRRVDGQYEGVHQCSHGGSSSAYGDPA